MTPTEQVFTEKGSMEDYFKNKMAAFKTKGKSMCNNNELNDRNSDIDNDATYGFQGFLGTKDNDCVSNNSVSLNIIDNNHSDIINSVIDSNYEIVTKTKKKKKKKCKEEPQDNICDTTSEDIITVDENVTKKCKRKQKQGNEDSEIKKQKTSKKLSQENVYGFDNIKKVVKKKKRKDKHL